MYRGLLQLGDIELANATRAATYVRNGVSSPNMQVICDESWAYQHSYLGQEAYELPVIDGAPWVDETEEASPEFAGVWVMSVEGLDSTPMDRDLVEAAGHGAALGYLRHPSREIQVEALVLAATPRGGAYGLSWLNSVLRSDGCGRQDQPRRLTWLDHRPRQDLRITEEESVAEGTAAARMCSQVVLTSPPVVKDHFGWTPEGMTSYRVEFTLTALVPFIWRLPITLVPDTDLSLGAPRMVAFETIGEDGTCPGGCDRHDEDVLRDPAESELHRIPRPLHAAASRGCTPVDSRRTIATVTDRVIPHGAQAVPEVTLVTNGRAERHIRIQWVRGTVTDTDMAGCDVVGEAAISYLPPMATLVLDGISGTATVTTSDGGVLDATPVTSGYAGGPWRPPLLDCDTAYSLVVDTEAEVDQGTMVSARALVRQL